MGTTTVVESARRALGPYRATMARLGYSEQAIAQVSDRLLDALAGLAR